MPCLVEHAGMVFVVNSVGVVVAAVWSYVVSLAGLFDVAIDNDFAIDGHGNVVALHADFLFAPFAKWFVLDALGWNDTSIDPVTGFVEMVGMIRKCVIR